MRGRRGLPRALPVPRVSLHEGEITPGCSAAAGQLNLLSLMNVILTPTVHIFSRK